MEQSPGSQSSVRISRRPRRAVPTVHITRRRPVRGGLATSQPVTEGESSLVAAMNTAFSAQEGPSQSSRDTHTVQTETDRRTPVPNLSQREGTIRSTPQASQPAAGPSGATAAVPPTPDVAEELQAITTSLVRRTFSHFCGSANTLVRLFYTSPGPAKILRSWWHSPVVLMLSLLVNRQRQSSAAHYGRASGSACWMARTVKSCTLHSESRWRRPASSCKTPPESLPTPLYDLVFSCVFSWLLLDFLVYLYV